MIDTCMPNNSRHNSNQKIINGNCPFLLIVPCTGDGGSTGDGLSQGSCENGLFCMENRLCLGKSESVWMLTKLIQM